MITTPELQILFPLLKETTLSCSVFVTETRDTYLQLFFLQNATNIHFDFNFLCFLKTAPLSAASIEICFSFHLSQPSLTRGQHLSPHSKIHLAVSGSIMHKINHISVGFASHWNPIYIHQLITRMETTISVC